MSRQRNRISEELYEVENIREERINHKGHSEFLVKWMDYPESENTWEPFTNLKNCRQEIIEFRSKDQKKDPQKESKIKPLLIELVDSSQSENETPNFPEQEETLNPQCSSSKKFESGQKLSLKQMRKADSELHSMQSVLTFKKIGETEELGNKFIDSLESSGVKKRIIKDPEYINGLLSEDKRKGQEEIRKIIKRGLNRQDGYNQNGEFKTFVVDMLQNSRDDIRENIKESQMEIESEVEEKFESKKEKLKFKGNILEKIEEQKSELGIMEVNSNDNRDYFFPEIFVRDVLKTDGKVYLKLEMQNSVCQSTVAVMSVDEIKKLNELYNKFEN